METLAELLARLDAIAELSEEDLAEIEGELEGAVADISEEATTADTVAALNSIADAMDSIRSERTRREEEAALLEAEALAAMSRIRGESDSTDEDDDTDEGDDVADEVDDETAEPEPEPETEPEPVPVAEAVPVAARSNARGAPLAQIARHQPRAGRTGPARARQQSNVRLYAAPDLRHFAAGQEFAGWDQAWEATADLLEHSVGGSGGGVIRRIGTLNWRDEYPADRTLLQGQDSEQNMRIVRDVVDPPVRTPQSLVAAGGLCAPLDVRYDVVDMSSAERPLRAALPSFRADRGGLQWMPSPVLTSVIVDNTGGAIDTTTVANDAAAGTKTVQEFTCPTAVSAQVQAISERLQFGNFADRYWPEQVGALMNLARARHARHAEQLLFEGMRSQSTLINTQMTLNPVGAFPNLVGIYRRASRGYRQEHRLSLDTTLRVTIPDWVEDVLASDLDYQAPGDGTLTDATATRQVFERKCAGFNVRPIWERDQARTNDANGAGAFPFSSATSAGALVDYPGRASSLMFHEGAFLFLDGGTLDFGIVRDSTLLSSNKWQTFYETFENVAMVGMASWNLTLQLCASGTRSALATVDCGPVGS